MKSLKELSELLAQADGDPEKMMPYAQDLSEFVDQMDSSATEILKGLGDDLPGFLSILESSAITTMMSEGDISLMQAIAIMSNKTLSTYSAYLIKYAIGLAAMEELR